MITVFTPTYNRAYIIEKLYESLCWQTCKDFEWLVVDDGSRDNTKELINSFMAEEQSKHSIYLSGEWRKATGYKQRGSFG